MVPEAGLEPALLSKTDFESVASTNFTTRALSLILNQSVVKTEGLYLEMLC